MLDRTWVCRQIANRLDSRLFLRQLRQESRGHIDNIVPRFLSQLT